MMDGATPEDFERLVARLAAGDRACETQLVARFQRGVRIAAARRLGRFQMLADDVAQETMARVIERLRAGALRDAHSLPGYVHACMRHVCDREIDRACQREGPSTTSGEPGAATVDLPSPQPGPAELAESGQIHALIRQLLAELPVPRDRVVLHRFYILQQEPLQICAELEVKHEHLHRLLSRARMRLAALLAKRTAPASLEPVR
jgi:RNA polymerase sigma-70 factor, ECF subfamily